MFFALLKRTFLIFLLIVLEREIELLKLTSLEDAAPSRTGKSNRKKYIYTQITQLEKLKSN